MDLEKNFTYHAPSTDQIKIYSDIRRMAHDYAEFLQSVSPTSRELSLALTKLEECVMWANASVARNG